MLPVMSSQEKKSESSSSSRESSKEEFSGPHSSSGRLKVTFLASEWRSRKGGLSTLNRELAINVAKHPEVEVTILVPLCEEGDKETALRHNIKLVEAIRRPGMDELAWLTCPPYDLEIDVVVGHGVKLGSQAQVIRNHRKCKWVQVVHTAPEELGMYKTYSNPLSVNEKKHKTEVELCDISDFVVTVGPKLTEAFRTYLRPSRKDQNVFEFTPGILADFSQVKQVVDERKKFGVLVFGRGDDEDFELKGFDIAAKAVAKLDDTHLTFVGAPDGKQDEVKTRLLNCGIPPDRLTVRSFLQSRDELKDLLCEVDLAIMPSRTEGFGLTGLEALSAGLPILVSGNSGFGEALSNVPFGPFFVIHSKDSEEWAKAIKNARDRNRENRLQESEVLRASYEKKYSWENRTKTLISEMTRLTQDSPVACQSSKRKTLLTHQTEFTTERLPGTVSIVIKMDSVTFRKAKSRDPMQQEEAKRLMKEMTNCFFETRADCVSAENYPLCLYYYLVGVLDLRVKEAVEGSLLITVECRTLEILERLWKDYCSGHLNEEAEKRLLTDDIKKRFDVESVKLETTISKDDYLACKLFLMDMSKVSKDSLLKEDESRPHDHTDQAADGTQTQTAEEAEPTTVHFADNDRGNFKNTQSENGAYEQEKGKESQQLLSQEETSDVAVDEIPQYFQHLELIHRPTPTEGDENSLRLTVKCNSLEGLESLWQDYRSGRINAIAEKYLVTDDIKRRFHLESVNLATAMREEDYLACKEFLSSKPKSNASSLVKASGETSTETSTETQNQILAKRGTLTSENVQIQPGEESQSQVVDKDEIFVSGNTRIPSPNETRTLTVERKEAQVTAETQIPSATETRTRAVEAIETQATCVSQIPSVEKPQTQATTESTDLTRDETQIQPAEETYTPKTTTGATCILDTEDADILFSEINKTEDTKESKSSILNDCPVACQSSKGKMLLTHQTEVMTERLPGTVSIVIKIDSVTFRKAKSTDPVQQEEAKRLIMKEMTNCFLETRADCVPAENYPLCLDYYLEGVLDLIVKEAVEGSLLMITVECRTLEILESLWKDYSSGHLNEVVERRLLTDDIKKRFDVKSVKLETTISKDDYLACKLFLMGMSKVSQDSSLKQDESRPHDQTDQAADGTRTQSAEELEPMAVHFADNKVSQDSSLKEDDSWPHDHTDQVSAGTRTQTAEGAEPMAVHFADNKVSQDTLLKEDESRLHDHTDQAADGTRTQSAEEVEPMAVYFADNCRVNFKNIQSENGAYEEEKGKESQLLLSQEETSDVAVDEIPQYFQHLELIHNPTPRKRRDIGSWLTFPTPTEGDENSLWFTSSTPTEGDENSLRFTLKCNSLEGLESLWQDYRSGRINTIAEKYLVTDEIKRIFHLESANLATTIREEDYLACKEFLSNKPIENFSGPALDIGAPSPQFFSLDLSNTMNRMKGHLEVLSLSQALKVNCMLTNLDVSFNNIDDSGACHLSEALKVNRTLTYLNLYHNRIGDSGMGHLSEALKVNGTLTNLNLDGNNIGESGMAHLSEALQVNRTLTNLDVSSNQIGDSGVAHISEALKVNGTLTNLRLGFNSIGGSGACHLSEALKVNGTLTNLKVSSNEIGDSGVAHLSEALKVNRTLTYLNVDFNQIGNSGTYHLSEALKVNGTLTNLHLAGNNIDDSGACHLSEALKLNLTLTELNLCLNQVGNSSEAHLSEALKVNGTLADVDNSGACHLTGFTLGDCICSFSKKLFPKNEERSALEIPKWKKRENIPGRFGRKLEKDDESLQYAETTIPKKLRKLESQTEQKSLGNVEKRGTSWQIWSEIGKDDESLQFAETTISSKLRKSESQTEQEEDVS